MRYRNNRVTVNIDNPVNYYEVFPMTRYYESRNWGQSLIPFQSKAYYVGY
jgi:hypothetical protein